MSNVIMTALSEITSHCAGTVQMREKAGQESEKRCDLRQQQKMEREVRRKTTDEQLNEIVKLNMIYDHINKINRIYGQTCSFLISFLRSASCFSLTLAFVAFCT